MPPARARRGLRRFVFDMVESAGEGDRPSRALDLFIITLILLNVAAVIVETVPGVPEAYGAPLAVFELFSVAVFSLEYLLRLWAVVESPRYRDAVLGRLRFMKSPLAIVDLLAVLPFYLPMVTQVDLRMLRALRLLRVFKFTRYSKSLRTLEDVVRRKRAQLGIALFTVLLMMVLAASLMYFVEHDDQPEAFASIPHAMWWAVATLTTVGYGDIYPVTGLGKVLASVLAILGMSMFALPAGILSAGFAEELERERGTSDSRCPRCGHDLDTAPGHEPKDDPESGD